MKLDKLALMLRGWLKPQLEKEDAYFLGDVKLVSCVSATEKTPYSGDKAVKSMAERLAVALAPRGRVPGSGGTCSDVAPL